jgi:hypothetical protein
VLLSILVLAGALQAPPHDAFSIRVDLQGLYDEMSESLVGARSAEDLDTLHDVLYADDYAVVDRDGHRRSWSEVREELLRTLNQAPPDWMTQTIQKVSPTSNGATVTVVLNTLRTITDTAGKYGPQGRSHMLTEVTNYRDEWAMSSVGWRLKLREQVGQPKQYVDKPLSDSAVTPPTVDQTKTPAPASPSAAQTDQSAGRLLGVLPNYATVGPHQTARPLSAGQTFHIAALNSFDPYIYPFVGFVASLNQEAGLEPTWGRGLSGYSKRYAAAFADNTIGNMMTTAVVPLLVRQDPRYYVLATGSIWHRAGYSASRSLIGRSLRGAAVFNVSEIGGNALAATIANVYYPSTSQTLSTTVERWGMQVMWDTLSNELKEFWPDVRNHLRHH